MHADEMPTGPPLVRRLLAAQFPQWADLPIEPVRSSGTDNALYRLGERMVVRLPRIRWAVGEVEQDLRWLRQLALRLPVAIPVPLAKGEPAEGYPRDIAEFLDALRRVDLAGGPPARRGKPLGEVQDEHVRVALAALDGTIDIEAATAAWDAALEAPGWTGRPVWVHGDLLSGNLLVRDGRLTGVIDWGGLGVGDPACDLIVAWGLIPPALRSTFRAAVAADDATWARGRGWALSVGLIALPYYRETNPTLAATARHLISEVLDDAA